MTQKSSRDEGLTYKQAGVDIDAKYAAVKRALPAIQATHTAGVMAGIGGFGSLFRLGAMGSFRDPVLVASTDGVGTKLAVAVKANRHDTVGRDLVNHCVNDILVMGARPLFFLDYISVGKMDPALVASILDGFSGACRENGCALVGGETAEMPDLYDPGDYDLAGFIVGVVERDRVLDGSAVRAGDRLLGLSSSGLHTNGYTLARRICFDRLKLMLADRPAALEGASVEEALLAVHRSYLHVLSPLLDAGIVHALCHITGGGFVENLPRVLPAGAAVRLRRDAWKPPAIFRFLVDEGRVPLDDAYRTLNMGIGMIVVVGANDAARASEMLARAGETATPIGEVVQGDRSVTWA